MTAKTLIDKMNPETRAVYEDARKSNWHDCFGKPIDPVSFALTWARLKTTFTELWDPQMLSSFLPKAKP